jgi:CRISPR-associated protein Csb2
MPAHLCLSVTFLAGRFHGRRDGGDPEWPPAPFRLYQALLAASRAVWREGVAAERVTAALRWLERQQPPEVVAPPHQVGSALRLAVPNNDLDVVAAAWARRQEPKKQPSELKTMKTVCPIHLPESAAVHYLYRLPEPVPEEIRRHTETLCSAALSLSHLGWGVDQVAGHGRILDAAAADDLRRQPGGEVWRAVDGPATGGLRVPQAGALDALARRHQAFLGRVTEGGFVPVPPLAAFAVAGYRRATDPPDRPFAAFEIWKPVRELARLPANQSRYRPFDPVGRAAAVAGMVRHAAARAAQAAGWPVERINSYIHGHTPDGAAQARGEHADRRLAFLPLPSLTPRGVDSIRRVLVVAPPGDGEAVAWVRQALSGRELYAEGRGEPVATLSLLSERDGSLTGYVGGSAAWSTVTPLVLPGRYTRGAGRARRLVGATLKQAGWPAELVEAAEVEWREVGFRPGVDLARRYLPGRSARRLSCHVRVRFPSAVRGPLAAGAMRYRGLGVFASEPEASA